MDEKLIVRLVGDVKQYLDAMKASEAATRQAAAEVKASAQKVEQFQNALNTAAGSVRSFTSMVLALAGVGGAMEAFKRSISVSAEAESMEIDFATMLRSGEKASKLMKDIRRLAADTPLETAGLVKVTRGLLQNQVGEDDVVETLRRLGDIAGGSQEKLQGLAYAFGQVRSMNRLMGEEKNQLLNWGFNPIQEMARTSGKYTAQLMDDMEKGKIGFKELEAAVISATSAGGQFFDGMKNRSKGLEGLYSTLKDDATMALKQFGDMVIEQLKLKDAVKELSAAFQGLTDYMKSVSKETRDEITWWVKWGAIVLGAVGTLKLLVVAKTALVALFGPTVAGLKLMADAYLALAAAMGVTTVAASAALVVAAAGVVALGAGIWYLADGIQTAKMESTGLTAELQRMARLAGDIEQIGKRRTKKFLDFVGTEVAPQDRRKTVETALEQAKVDQAAAQEAYDKQKQEIQKFSGAGSIALSMLPYFGSEEVAEYELALANLKALGKNLDNATARASDLKKALKGMEPDKPTGEMEKWINSMYKDAEVAVASLGKVGVAAEIAKAKVEKGFLPKDTERDLLTQGRQVEFMKALRKSKDDSNELAKDIYVLRETLSMTDVEAAKFKGSLIDLGQNGFKKLGGDAKTARDALIAWKYDLEEAKRANEQFKDPVTKFGEEVDKMSKLLASGFISSRTYARALAQAANGLDVVKDKAADARREVQRFDAALADSAEGTARMYDYMNSLDRKDKDKKNLPGVLGPPKSFEEQIFRFAGLDQQGRAPTQDAEVKKILTNIEKNTKEAVKREAAKKLPPANLAPAGSGLGAPQ